MIDPTATINARDIARLDNILLDVAVVTGRSVGQVIVQTTIFAAQSAAKATPLAKKNRRVVNVGRMGKKARMARGVPWWASYSVEVWKKDKAHQLFVSTPARLAKYRPVPRRGLARASWMRSLSAIGGRPEGWAPAKVSRMTVTKKDGNIMSTRNDNFTKYMPKIAPSSGTVGLAKATNRMESAYLRQAEGQIMRAMLKAGGG